MVVRITGFIYSFFWKDKKNWLEWHYFDKQQVERLRMSDLLFVGVSRTPCLCTANFRVFMLSIALKLQVFRVIRFQLTEQLTFYPSSLSAISTARLLNPPLPLPCEFHSSGRPLNSEKMPSLSLCTLRMQHCYFSTPVKYHWRLMQPIWWWNRLEHKYEASWQQEYWLRASFSSVWQCGTREPHARKWSSPFSMAVTHIDFFSPFITAVRLTFSLTWTMDVF